MEINSPCHKSYFAATFLLTVWEWWLGKTKRVTPNSTIALLFYIINWGRNKMLEGKEVDVALGSVGRASVDINDKGEVEISVSAKIDLLGELHKLAAKSGTKLDDVVVAAIEKLLGRVPPSA